MRLGRYNEMTGLRCDGVKDGFSSANGSFCGEDDDLAGGAARAGRRFAKCVLGRPKNMPLRLARTDGRRLSTRSRREASHTSPCAPPPRQQPRRTRRALSKHACSMRNCSSVEIACLVAMGHFDASITSSGRLRFLPPNSVKHSTASCSIDRSPLYIHVSFWRREHGHVNTLCYSHVMDGSRCQPALKALPRVYNAAAIVEWMRHSSIIGDCRSRWMQVVRVHGMAWYWCLGLDCCGRPRVDTARFRPMCWRRES